MFWKTLLFLGFVFLPRSTLIQITIKVELRLLLMEAKLYSTRLYKLLWSIWQKFRQEPWKAKVGQNYASSHSNKENKLFFPCRKNEENSWHRKLHTPRILEHHIPCISLLILCGGGIYKNWWYLRTRLSHLLTKNNEETGGIGDYSTNSVMGYKIFSR